MAKKSIINNGANNPALKFITPQADTTPGQIEQQQPAPSQATEKTPIKATIDEYERLYTTKKERKSQRLQLLITPSTFEKLQRMREQTGQSINDFISQALEDILKEY